MASQLSLVLGGVRSGKSAFAEGLVREACGTILYLATGVPTDPEMEERIRRHQMTRPTHWTTIEEPLDLAGRLNTATISTKPPAAVLLDSLDIWVANLLMEEEANLSMEEEANPSIQEDDSAVGSAEPAALCAVDRLLQVIGQASGEFVLVSSEVGLSLVPPEPLGRRFQDLLGTVNQRVAAAAERVYLVVAGIPTEIKGPDRAWSRY